MQYYFDDLGRQDQLKLILDTWMDTPFRHKAGVKGVGCDCIHFVARVFQEMGLVTWHRNLIPEYSYDWHLHNPRELLAEGIENTLNVEKMPLGALKKNGDILLFHYGQASSHAAIFFDNYIYQSLADVGVCKIHISDRLFRKQLRFIYRVIE